MSLPAVWLKDKEVGENTVFTAEFVVEGPGQDGVADRFSLESQFEEPSESGRFQKSRYPVLDRRVEGKIFVGVILPDPFARTDNVSDGFYGQFACEHSTNILFQNKKTRRAFDRFWRRVPTAKTGH